MVVLSVQETETLSVEEDDTSIFEVPEYFVVYIPAIEPEEGEIIYDSPKYMY